MNKEEKLVQNTNPKNKGEEKNADKKNALEPAMNNKKPEQKNEDRDKKEPIFEPAPVKKKPHPVPKQEIKQEEQEKEEELLETEEDESLVVENDGDFFWLLQKAVWTFVKILFLFGGVILIIWVIWGDKEKEEGLAPTTENSQEEEQKHPPVIPQKEASKEKEGENKAVGSEPKTETTETVVETKSDSQNTKQEVVLRDDVGIYLDWAFRTKNFFETEMDTEIWGTNIAVRNQRMDSFLGKIQKLVGESVTLRKQLVMKINAYYSGIEQSNKMIAYHTARLNEGLQLVRPSEVETHLYQKIALQKQREQYQVFFDTNRYVLQVMEIYDRAIRDVYEKARINRDAIVKNVRVVRFENDPFQRVLTPAEWQAR